jgi:hypothetical protein
MKKTLLFFLLFFGLLSITTLIQAQNNIKWQPMFLTVSGSNIIDGVEGYFAQDICNSEPVILVKFINKNAYNVNISWFDGFFTADTKWINKNEAKDLKKITLSAQNEIEGDCFVQNPFLIIKIKDVLPSVADFKRYNASSIVISIN